MAARFEKRVAPLPGDGIGPEVDDILTDLGAPLAGGLGLAAGANLNSQRRYPSMIEPVHGRR